VHLEAIVFAEASRIEQELDPLARGELAGLVLALDARSAPTLQGPLVELLQLLDFFLDRQV
jgi:hypothetical protein